MIAYERPEQRKRLEVFPQDDGSVLLVVSDNLGRGGERQVSFGLSRQEFAEVARQARVPA